ncbi:MAG: triose-phosphate isomerase [Pseudolysinimonas sp.]|uniref:triose-phosphate isomerase n=1 Tax=Pseudolysinimonas sp. TaxID=2680009 RepID=UPI003C74342C
MHAGGRSAPWLGTSWKMNKTIGEAEAYARSLAAYASTRSSTSQLFVVPPFTAIARVAQILTGTGILVGAQDVHPEPDGPHTGDISAGMLLDAGATLVEIGHQERRRDHHEDDVLVRAKVRRTLDSGLRPLLCVGELGYERSLGAATSTVERQIRVALHGLADDEWDRVVVAYEPAWSIGTDGTPATPAQVAEVHDVIRHTAHVIGGAGVRVPVLYGGGVRPENTAELVALADVDGLFVGRAALDVEVFIHLDQIIDTALVAVKE